MRSGDAGSRYIADMIRIPALRHDSPDVFPDVSCALAEPDGLLASGGGLSPERLLAAYRRGIFPWYSEGQPVLWWSPALRTVFDTGAMHVPRRLARWLRTCEWTIGADAAFEDTVRACAAPRRHQRGTWITRDMLAAYVRLHALGHAHSVEVRDETGRMVGGIYGVAVGRMFCGESMFSQATNGSKVALLALARVLAGWEWPLLDAQIASEHLFTLGAREMRRSAYCAEVARLSVLPAAAGDWSEKWPSMRAAELVS